jgi:hypothetical protein
MPKRSTPRPKPSQKPAKKQSRPNISRPKHSPKENGQMAEPTSSKGNSSPAAAPAAPAAGAPTERQQQASIRYLDQADMAETFADSITGLMFDGQTLRIEFGVTRFDEVNPTRRSPAAVIRPAASCCRRRPRSSSSTACSRSRTRSRKPAS